MQQGLSIQELADRVLADAPRKRDFIADSRACTMTPEGRFTIEGIDPNPAPAVETLDDAAALGRGALDDIAIADPSTAPVETLERALDSFECGPVMHSQLATKCGIPARYYRLMQEHCPALLAMNVNHWLHVQAERRMIRTLGRQCRALLSDRYRPLDHQDLLEAILPAIAASGLVVRSSQITDRRLYIQASTPRLTAEIKVGDAVEAGIVISNSEVGEGALAVEEMVYRLECSNGMVYGHALRRNHVGRAAGNGIGGNGGEPGGGRGGEEFYRDSTRRLDDAALFAKTRDTVEGILTSRNWETRVDELRRAADGPAAANPIKATEEIAKRLDLSDKEGASVLAALATGGDLTAYGMSNAVTQLAHKAESYDRAVELERAGHKVIELPPADWQRIADLN